MARVIDIFKRLLGRKASVMDVGRVYDEICKILPSRQVLRLTPVRAEDTTVLDCKLGGVPYMPSGFEWPKGRGVYESEALRLLVQINFSRLPHLDGYPDKGILQVFCSSNADKVLYGMGAHSSDRRQQDGFRVIYHKDIVEDVNELMTGKEMPQFEVACDFPFEGEFVLLPESISNDCVTSSDFRFHDVAVEVINKLYEKKIVSLSELDADFRDTLYAQGVSHGCHIGGYSYFTQDDPRYDAHYASHQVTLLQIDSHQDADGCYDISWGDGGVANFLIENEKLKNCDFSSVIYNWDC